MRAILIDASARTITEIEVEAGVTGLQKALGARMVECFQIHGFERGHAPVRAIDLWTDEEAALGSAHTGFTLAGERDSVEFIGNGLILDCDWEGACVGTRMPLEAVRQVVSFVAYDEANPMPEPEVRFIPLDF